MPEVSDSNASFVHFVELDFVQKGSNAEAELGEGRRLFGGFCGSDKKDRQGETLIQKKMRFDEFEEFGWFNDNHAQQITEGGCLGYPIKKDPIRWMNKGQANPLTKKPVKRDGWYVIGELLGTRRADELVETAKALEGTPRRLGLSVEGSARRRKGSEVWADVRNIAVTHMPVAHDTTTDVLDTINKALSAGTDVQAPAGAPSPGIGFPLRTEHLDAAIKEPENPTAEDDEDDDEEKKKKKKTAKALDPEDAADALRKARSDAPNYRNAGEDAKYRCGTCVFYKKQTRQAGRCALHNFNAKDSWVCDSWAGRKEKHMSSQDKQATEPVKKSKTSDGGMSFEQAVGVIKSRMPGITDRQARQVAHRIFAGYNSQQQKESAR